MLDKILIFWLNHHKTHFYIKIELIGQPKINMQNHKNPNNNFSITIVAVLLITWLFFIHNSLNLNKA